MAAYLSILSGMPKEKFSPPVKKKKPLTTLKWLIGEYWESPYWTSLLRRL
ncbi:hypothetical protein HUT03_05440 [Candidatus Liberibacter africanus]|nr:hypothetical protein [Candidatus Liberibacter africanus]QTP64350.1 hypothetical protein HUT03_05440 [Candidatus Liberibacter africanus]